MAFGDTSKAIIVTGVNPADQSAGETLSSGDTVNTGKGGGPTTLGTNSQGIKPGTGLIFTFATGMDSNYIAPNLTPGEAGVEANIDFGSLALFGGGTVDIVQKSGKPTDGVAIKLSAYTTDFEEKEDFTNGLGDTDDLLQVINSITIENASGLVYTATRSLPLPQTQIFDPAGELKVTFNGDGTVNLDGILSDWSISYTTATDHSRLRVDNAETSGTMSFDIGGFSLDETSSKTVPIGQAIGFEDDGPKIDIVAGTALVVDESVGTAGSILNEGGAANNDETAAGAAAGAIGYATGTLFTVNAAGTSAGVDGEASRVFALSVTNSASGRIDAQTNEAVTLSVNADGTLVTGNSATGGIVFTLSINSTTGAATLNQFRAVEHNDSADHDENGTSAASLLAGRIALGVSLTDGDGDKATDTIDISGLLKFEDDGPAIDIAVGTTPLVVDESVGTTGSVLNEGGAVNNDETAAGAAAGAIGYATGTLFTVNAAGTDAGSDGEASRVYALSVTNSASGLIDAQSDQNVVLSLVGGVVEGRTAVGNALVFTLSINSATGAVTLNQFRAVEHNDSADHDENGTSAAGLTAGTIGLGVTLTDGDGDTATDTIDISGLLKFEDDGPAIAINNSSGTFGAGAQGSWDHDPGSDTFASISLVLNSYAINDGNAATNDTVTVNSSLGTKTTTVNGNYVFTGSITGDFTPNDGKVNPQTVNFTLTLDPDNPETYSLQLTTPPATVVLKDTSQGQLKAGGPDAVQTLLFGGSEAGSDDVVFFGVVATAPKENGPGTAPNDLEDLIGGVDLSEAAIEAFLTPTNQIPTLINSGTQMNVSTSGIGINNNNLDGDGATGIQNGDESFVFNPEENADSVIVYIDNSVGGYDPATEELYYTVYYTDGSVLADVRVTADMLEAALRTDPNVPQVARGGSFFEIDGGDKEIDAVQLTMGLGTVKIPVIQWAIEQEFNPAPLDLNFTATLVDKDGDSSSDPFSISLV